jgi:hypothetical protein
MVRLALAIVLLGCGPSADGYPFLREAGCERPCEPDAGIPDAGMNDSGPPEIPEEPLEAWDETGAGPLTGIFAVEVVIPARAIVELETRQIYRLRILQRAEQTRLLISPCKFSLPSIPSAATLTIPPRLEDVLRSIAIDREGAFLSQADPVGATIMTPQVFVVLGADLAMPETDPLPTEDMPAGALDQDADGMPGVTIDASTVLCRTAVEQIYAALRASVTMSATIDDLDRFEGTVMPTLEQTVLGISHRCLTAASTLEIEILDGSTFTAIRVGEAQDIDGNGNVSCPEMGHNAGRLFGEYWY